MIADIPERPSFFFRFYRALLPLAGVLFCILGYYAIAGDLQPTAELEKYPFWARLVAVLGVAPFSFALGFLVMRRTPGNVIGPVIVLWGCIASSEYAAGFLPPFLAALSILYVMVILFPAFFLMLGLFPTGQGVTPFWDRAMKAAVVAAALFSLLVNLSSPRAYGLTVPSPLAIPALVPWFDRLNWTSSIYGLTVLLALVLLVLRYRAANAVQRKQMRWLIIFVVYFMVTFFVGPLTYRIWKTGIVSSLISLSVLVVPPAVIGLAILRHRLWDIDLFIRRTLQYAILSAVLGLIYFGGVVILQTAFGALTGDRESPLTTVITTLAIAALFNPLRLRIQHFIDRRFYRQRYDASQALDRFASTARDEVDLDKLSTALIDMVQLTMAPESASLWLSNDSLASNRKPAYLAAATAVNLQ